MKLEPGRRFYHRGWMLPWVEVDNEGRVKLFRQNVRLLMKAHPEVVNEDGWVDYDTGEGGDDAYLPWIKAAERLKAKP